MIEKTEQEIMQFWQGAMMVSITCVAYNHEDFLHDTLDSFLMQETLFPFEILINDDVSTDRTVEILKEYEKKYPNIIKPVYQTENQYSQGVNPMAILFPFITGQYVAFCDGDDHWTDKEKLQIQVDAMKEHPEVDLCFHSTYKLVNGERTELLAKRADKNQIFPIKHSILGRGDFIETASMLFTRPLISSLPDWFKTALPGDYVSEIMGAARGGSLYIDRPMAVYRAELEGGWTINELKKSSAERKQSLLNIVHQLEFLDDYLKNKHHHDFQQVIHDEVYSFLTIVNNGYEEKETLFEQYKVNFTGKEKLLWYFFYRHQTVLEILKGIKNGVLRQTT